MRRISLLPFLSALALVACGGASEVPYATAPPYVPLLTDVDFVDAQTGWVSGQGVILSTKDAGLTWQVQYTGPETFVDIDFISPLVGWAVGVDRLFSTTDGGATWKVLSEPPAPLAAVNFIDQSHGWGVSKSEPHPFLGGELVKTTDGGRSWFGQITPLAVQSACASSASVVWAVAGKDVLHSNDGGDTWSASLTVSLPDYNGWAGLVQCASPDVAWVRFVSRGAVSNPWAVYRTIDGGGHWDVMMAQQYTFVGVVAAPDTPGDYEGPFSVVDGKMTFVMGYCGPCGEGRTYVRATVDGGTTWSSDTLVSDRFLQPSAVDFVDASHGWVLFNTAGRGEISFTSDGGRTWTKEYP